MALLHPINRAIMLIFCINILSTILQPSSAQNSGHRGRNRVSSRRLSDCDRLSSSTGVEYLLDPESGRCYPLGSRGPCGQLMTFYRHPVKEQTGFCDCEQGHRDLDKPCADNPIRKRIYYPKELRCYMTFSRGPCILRDQWFVLNESQDVGICVPNPCLELGGVQERGEQFWFSDPRIDPKSCYKSFTQGYCPPGQHLELVHDSQYPKCRLPTCSGSLAYGIISFGQLTCRAGSRFSYLTGSCRGFYSRFRSIG